MDADLPYRSELIDATIQDARDSLYIRNAAHPIAGGLTGKVKVYDPPYSLNFGLPSADADVVASVEEDGSYPTIFVYEKGDKLVDDSLAPNPRVLPYDRALDARVFLDLALAPDHGVGTDAGARLGAAVDVGPVQEAAHETAPPGLHAGGDSGRSAGCL